VGREEPGQSKRKGKHLSQGKAGESIEKNGLEKGKGRSEVKVLSGDWCVKKMVDHINMTRCAKTHNDWKEGKEKGSNRIRGGLIRVY